MEGQRQEEVSISEEDEEFDPMTKDFNDPSFNSYKCGPGSYISPNLHTQKRWEGEENQVYKLFVSSIPLGINDCGFQNIFSNFGVVLKAYLAVAKSGKCKFGFIEYRTLREAERAIYSVNNIPPLGLTVKFAITDEAKQNRDSVLFETPVCSMEQNQSTSTNKDGKDVWTARSRGRGQLLAPMTGAKPSEMVSTYKWPKDYATTLYSSSLKLCNIFSHPTTEPLLWSYHEALAYEKPVLSPDCRFVIALGRGRAIVNLVDESERYHSSTQSNEKPYVYKYGGSKSDSEVVSSSRPCCVCSKRAVRICFNCQKRFCSKICLRNDPPNHVITPHGLVMCYNRVGEGAFDSKCRGIFVKRLIFPPANFTDIPYDDLDPRSPRPLSNRNSHLCGNIFIFNPSSLKMAETPEDDANMGSLDKGNEQNPGAPLPFDRSTKVVVFHVISRGEYFVSPCYLKDELREMTNILTAMAPCMQKVSNPILDSIYIHLYDDLWSRAKVVQIEPKLKVFYIDWGQEEILTESNFKELPLLMSSTKFPPMVVKIKVVVEGIDAGWLHSVAQSTKFYVRPISKDEEGYTVKVVKLDQFGSDDSLFLPENQVHLKSGHILQVADHNNFELSITSVLGPGRFCGTLDFNPLISHLTPGLMKSTLVAAASNRLSLDRVKLGEMVGCVTEDDIYRRGYISSLVEGIGARVSLVDEAFVCSTQTLFSLPDSVNLAPETAVFCLLDPSGRAMQVGNKVKCRRSELLVGLNQVKCEVEGYGNAVLTPWSPRVEDIGLMNVALTSGSSVTVSSYYSPQDVYVQSLEPKHVALLDTLLQDVAAYASTADGLDREPEVGEVVACLHPEDCNYYRAQIYKKLGYVFTVIYLDYGNSCDVTSDLMKPLPNSLKMVPCCAVRIQLEGVSESLMTRDAVHFLNANACGKPLYLEINENQKGCILKTSEGHSINAKIEELIRPQWKICLQQETDPTNGEVFFGYDVKYLKWESGRKVKLLVVRLLEKDSCLVLDTEDGLLDLTKNYFTPRYSDYCSSFAKHFQYTPRLREICLVSIRDEKGWFRAVCTAVYEVSCWVVLVDFGTAGEVYFSEIRPITYELMQFPSILKKCNVVYPTDTPDTIKGDKLKDGSIFEATVVEETSPGVIKANFKDLIF